MDEGKKTYKHICKHCTHSARLFGSAADYAQRFCHNIKRAGGRERERERESLMLNVPCAQCDLFVILPMSGLSCYVLSGIVGSSVYTRVGVVAMVLAVMMMVMNVRTYIRNISRHFELYIFLRFSSACVSQTFFPHIIVIIIIIHLVGQHCLSCLFFFAVASSYSISRVTGKFIIVVIGDKTQHTIFLLMVTSANVSIWCIMVTQ